MRILMLHNRYRAEGGEERAVEEIADLLRARGHTVDVLERRSDATNRAQAARALVTGGMAPDEVTNAVRRTRADVVHAHNLHPLLGWRALAAARAEGARTIVHLHNFRLFCAIGVAYRDGATCFRCRDGNTLPGLLLRCRGSTAEAAVYAAGLWRQLPRLLEHTDRFVAVSDATLAQLTALGLPAGRASALPNFAAAKRFAERSRADRGGYALVAGRLVEEKGFDTAIAAARRTGVPLVVVGDGPDEARLRSLAVGAEVRFTGRLAPEALADVRAQAAVLLAPSRWEEPWPYTVLDALAAGVPVLASDRGGLPELVGLGATLAAHDVGEWERALRTLWVDPPARLRRGEAGLARAQKRFGEDQYYESLMRLYEGSELGPRG